MAYSIPRDVFLLLEAAFNQDREKAEVFAKAIEGSIQAIENQADERITHKKESLKAELYNELRAELATKEFVRAEINGVRAEISELRAEVKQNSLLLKILIGIAVFGLTLFNPAFVKLVELVIK
jgi:tRNA U34 5-carboxymethylaminomethyl modifying GTPase MnmE/TrmE